MACRTGYRVQDLFGVLIMMLERQGLTRAQTIVPPLLFTHPTVNSVAMLQALAKKVFEGDARWDNLHRIEYSTPGRWVQSLDMSAMSVDDEDQLAFDSILRRLIPILPFLGSIHLNARLQLSRGAYTALQAVRLRVLTGAVFDAPHLGPTAPAGSPAAAHMLYRSLQDPLLCLLRNCAFLQELELVPPEGDDQSDVEDDFPIPEGAEEELHEPLELPKLSRFALLLKPEAPLARLFARSLLPSLQHLVLHAELANSTSFLEVHGANLRVLALFVPPKATVSGYPTNLLSTCPSLRHLVLPSSAIPLQPDPGHEHPLITLSIPRPDPHLLRTLEMGTFPALRVVQLRDARWLRRGVASQARFAGIAGEMSRWKTRLGRLNIRVVDAAGRQDGA